MARWLPLTGCQARQRRSLPEDISAPGGERWCCDPYPELWRLHISPLIIIQLLSLIVRDTESWLSEETVRYTVEECSNWIALPSLANGVKQKLFLSIIDQSR
jgi:hypothetical protein